MRHNFGSFQKVKGGGIRTEDYFKTLNAINVKDKTEKKNGLTYLSWAWAISEVLKICPNMTYEVKKFNDLPYVYDDKTGYMVYTSVTIDGITREMWLPVMDGANKAMKSEPYTYKDRYGKEKTVDAATMFDVNKTIMRCLTKNLAMFGLGLYIYAGEDLPETEELPEKPKSEYSYICADCGNPILMHGDYSAWKIASTAKKKHGRELCFDCGVKANGSAKS